MSRKHVVWGDWRDLREAIEAADPAWQDKPEAEREAAWKFAEGVIREFAPLRVKCGPFGCGDVIPWSRAYRCADCRAVYCEHCIKPHFQSEAPATRHPPAADDYPSQFKDAAEAGLQSPEVE